MPPVPAAILALLADHHVLTLSVQDAQGPWASSAFFAYDPRDVALIFLGSMDTRHAQAIQADPRIAGCVAGQPRDISQILGLQFAGSAFVVEDEVEKARVLALYHQRFPETRKVSSPVWMATLDVMKLTDNRVKFGTKTHWRRAAE
ncbi:pyridoxamine 5'-phosphate oxidase family protein [Bordetella sp. LUAb4]|uniref:pyridoxamine 5'-phosphate oxidase family protein n=1 Tax=Bordetella sp. LUAb4 TaxID=2843195 RepID=UPI001E428825|nr:pyridoxamine 5'-phosphate oxidase family protein [Bordetella sp. LUAb4]